MSKSGGAKCNKKERVQDEKEQVKEAIRIFLLRFFSGEELPTAEELAQNLELIASEVIRLKMFGELAQLGKNILTEINHPLDEVTRARLRQLIASFSALEAEPETTVIFRRNHSGESSWPRDESLLALIAARQHKRPAVKKSH